MTDLLPYLNSVAIDFWGLWDSTMVRSVINASIVLLISTMVVKELLIAMGGSWRSFARYLNIPIVLLLIVLALELAHRVNVMSGNGQ